MGGGWCRVPGGAGLSLAPVVKMMGEARSPGRARPGCQGKGQGRWHLATSRYPEPEADLLRGDTEAPGGPPLPPAREPSARFGQPGAHRPSPCAGQEQGEAREDHLRLPGGQRRRADLPRGRGDRRHGGGGPGVVGTYPRPPIPSGSLGRGLPRWAGTFCPCANCQSRCGSGNARGMRFSRGHTRGCFTFSRCKPSS